MFQKAGGKWSRRRFLWLLANGLIGAEVLAYKPKFFSIPAPAPAPAPISFILDPEMPLDKILILPKDICGTILVPADLYKDAWLLTQGQKRLNWRLERA